MTDPVGFGLVTSEARPAANVSGVLYRLEGMTEKQVEIGLDLMPRASKIGILDDVNIQRARCSGARPRSPPGRQE